jgi:bifunctional DNase/RNase
MEMLEVEIWTIARTEQGNAVLLRPLGSELIVPVFVGQLEVQSILTGNGDIKTPRPLAHDLLLSLLRQTGLSLSRVEVHSLRDSTFYARLIIFGGGFSEKRPLVLDSRPSDAFALAVRRRCPIYISRRILDQTGVPAEFILDGPEEDGGIRSSPSPGPLSRSGKYRELLEELNRAVDAEEYEQAAEIRDLLILLDKEQGEAPRDRE